MEQMPNTQPTIPQPNSIKSLLVSILVLVIILLALGYWFFVRPAQYPASPTTSSSQPAIEADSAVSISQDLKSIDNPNLDKEFESVDKDAKTL